MNGKTARALRKECGFHPNDKRDYQEIEFTVRRKIWQFGVDAEGKTTTNLAWSDVPAYLKECTSGARKIYKYMKRKWTNINYEASFNKLPSAADLENIANTVIDDEELIENMKNMKNKINNNSDEDRKGENNE